MLINRNILLSRHILTKGVVKILRFCPACGHSVDDNVLYCPACGKKLSDQNLIQGSVPPPPPPNSPYYTPNVSSTFGDADKKALRKLTIFAVLILVSLVVGFAISFLNNPFSYLFIINYATAGATTPTFTLSSNFLIFVGIAGLVGLVVEIVTFLQLRSAFKTLASVDRPHFRIPSVLTLLLIIALPLLIAGVIIEFAGLVPFINSISQQQAANTTPTLPTSGLGTLFAGLAMAFIGGIIALIGIIGGPILGMWRMGSRYDDTLIKIAAILFIIPLVDILTPILLLIGASQAGKKIVPVAP